jgi:WD40 repeat protein
MIILESALLCRDRFVAINEYNITKAAPLAFCASGYLFAAAGAGSFSITVYETFTGETYTRLKGHTGRVANVAWTRDDSILVSCSLDGAVIFWDIRSRSRLKDLQFGNKLNQFDTLVPSSDGRSAAVRSRSGTITLVKDGCAAHDVEGPAGDKTPVLVLGGEQLLAAGNGIGEIQTWPWPRAVPAPQSFQQSMALPAHGAPVSAMCVCAGGTMLVSASADGVVIVWDMQVDPWHARIALARQMQHDWLVHHTLSVYLWMRASLCNVPD